ncbi:MAG: hypothetical protein L3J02_08145 [Henriciella sp.]|nr:hypothetical protein [Henriciella sp.]
MSETKVPAVLISSDEQTLTALKSELAEAMGVASVELGPNDLTQGSVISVLPPRLGPLEGHSMAKPTQFDLMKTNSNCYIVRRGTGDVYRLSGLTCRGLQE